MLLWPTSTNRGEGRTRARAGCHPERYSPALSETFSFVGTAFFESPVNTWGSHAHVVLDSQFFTAARGYPRMTKAKFKGKESIIRSYSVNKAANAQAYDSPRLA